MSPSLCHLAQALGVTCCYRCCCGCRDESEDFENCPTGDARQHYSFLLHSEICNSPEHQFCWPRSEFGFCDRHTGNWKSSEHPPSPLTPAEGCGVLRCFVHGVFMWTFQYQTAALMVTAGQLFGLLLKCSENLRSLFFFSHKPACSSLPNSQVTSLFVPSCFILYTDSASIICVNLFMWIRNTWISPGQEPDLTGIDILLPS